MFEITTKKNITCDKFLSLIQCKFGKDFSGYEYLQKLVNGRVLYDYSGHSGDSTLIVNGDSDKGYVIKISKNKKLYEEYLAYNFFYKNNLTSKPLKYYKCNDYEIMIVEKIELPLVDHKYNNLNDILIVVAKNLKKMHEINLINNIETEEERSVFESKYKDNFEEALKSKEGLLYLKNYIYDKDINETKKYLIRHKDILFKNAVLVHGDFGQTNIFECDNDLKIIDFKNVGIVNIYYDIFWAFFLTILFAGILDDKEKVEDAKKIYLKAYGIEKFSQEEWDFFKRYSYLYWKQHDNIVRFEEI